MRIANLLSRYSLLLAVVALVPCSGQVIPETARPMRWDGTNGVAFFGNGIVRRANIPIRAYAAGIKRGTDIDLFEDFPDLKDAAVDDIAAGPDGKTTLAAVLRDSSDHIRFVILTYDSAGRLLRLWDTAPYSAAAIATDLDGSVYALGTRVGAKPDGPPFPMLTHYSVDGRVIGQGLFSSAFNGGPIAISNGQFGDGAVMTLRDKQLYIYAPFSSEVLICTTDGTVVRHIDLRPILQVIAESDLVDEAIVRTVAFAGHNHVVLDMSERTKSGKDMIASIRTLNLATGTMKTLVSEQQRRTVLLGAKNGHAILVHPSGIRGVSLDNKPIPD